MEQNQKSVTYQCYLYSGLGRFNKLTKTNRDEAGGKPGEGYYGIQDTSPVRKEGDFLERVNKRYQRSL